MRYDVSGGDNAYARVPSTRDMDTYAQLTRFTFRSFTGTETELGTLKTVTEVRYQWYNGADSSSSGSLRLGFIELGGLRVGLDQSAFVTFTDYLGNVLNDDVILAGGYRTNLISYTYKTRRASRLPCHLNRVETQMRTSMLPSMITCRMWWVV